MNSTYYNDPYKYYNYWSQRYRVGPTNVPVSYLVWYYNYYYPRAQRGIVTPGYLSPPHYMFMGRAPNGY